MPLLNQNSLQGCCPSCGLPLQRVVIDGILAGHCAACGLLWSNETTLRRLAIAPLLPSVQVKAPLPVLTNSSESKVCPACETATLVVGTWRGVPLGLCKRCGGVLLETSRLVEVQRLLSEQPRLERHGQSAPPPDGVAVVDASDAVEAGASILVEFLATLSDHG